MAAERGAATLGGMLAGILPTCQMDEQAAGNEGVTNGTSEQ
jgi:hypothetical protein